MNTISLIIITAIICLLIGAAGWSTTTKHRRRLIDRYKQRAPLVKKYWKLIVPLILLTTLAYVLVFMYARTEINISLVGQISGFILAIGAGYIAFVELGESRFDKLEQDGMTAVSLGHNKRAALKLEEAHAIRPRETVLLSNLLELYIITESYEKFENKIKFFKQVAIEDVDELHALHLQSLKELAQERGKDARQRIEEAVTFINTHPHARDTFIWRDEEFKESDIYPALNQSTRKIFHNFTKYLLKQLSASDEARFISGDHELRPASKSVMSNKS